MDWNTPDLLGVCVWLVKPFGKVISTHPDMMSSLRQLLLLYVMVHYRCISHTPSAPRPAVPHYPHDCPILPSCFHCNSISGFEAHVAFFLLLAGAGMGLEKIVLNESALSLPSCMIINA